MTKDEAKVNLAALLNRREKYFLLEGIQRKIYQVEFEKIQREIIQLKLFLEIYHDELDFLVVEFNYFGPEGISKNDICNKAQELREVWWMRKKYNPNNGQAVYVGQVKSELTDPWLNELFKLQQIKRQGLIE